MDRIRRDRRIRAHQGLRRAGGASVVLALAASLIPIPAASYGDLPPLELTDLWDVPQALEEITGGRITILLICNPEEAACREAAVYLDSRAGRIRSAGAKGAIVFVGDPAPIRDVALSLDLDLPVYIDPERTVFGSMLDRRILPALVRMAGSGEPERVAYGGGESLETNLSRVLETAPGPRPSWMVIVLGAAAIVGLVLLVGD
jgi:hypothetical protein